MIRTCLCIVMLAGAFAFSSGICAGEEPKSDGRTAAEELNWRLGAQAYTFRRMTFFEAVDIISELGMKYVEMYPGQRVSKDIDARTQPGMSGEVMDKIKAKLKSSGVELVNYGVAPLPGDEEKCRYIFEWAQKMGIETIAAESDPTDLPMIDKLAQEFGINVALHNHPKASRASQYWHPDRVLDACKGLSKRIGACVDTGHWVRSGLDPVEALRKLEGRIIALHFKDLKKGRDVPWGTGECNAEAMLAELKRQGFEGVFSMEYESHWTREDLAECVKFFHARCEKLAGKAVWPGGGREAGAIALLRNDGILLMTQGAHHSLGAWVLRQALIDRKDLKTLLKEQKEPFLYPEYDWEQKGFTGRTTVANGLVPFKGQWMLYYGAADTDLARAEAALARAAAPRSGLEDALTPNDFRKET